jgi:hypothetical protein
VTLTEASSSLNKILRDRITHEARPFFCVSLRESTNELVLFFEPVIKWRILKLFNVNSVKDACVWEGYKVILRETGAPTLN